LKTQPAVVDPLPRASRKTLVYRTLRAAVSAWCRGVHRMRVEGARNLPLSGGVLLVANHQSALDVPMIAAATRRHVGFVARASLGRSRLLAWIMARCGAVLVRPGEADREALRNMVLRLRSGDCLAIFPEGTRSTDGRGGEFRGGGVLAARRAGVPIVPVGIRGSREAWPRGARRPRLAPVCLCFGPALDPRAPEALAEARRAVAALVGDGRVGA
jgi:1-acyl-sn-glycerol-3-phosphate acyltransferase